MLYLHQPYFSLWEQRYFWNHVLGIQVASKTRPPFRATNKSASYSSVQKNENHFVLFFFVALREKVSKLRQAQSRTEFNHEFVKAVQQKTFKKMKII